MADDTVADPATGRSGQNGGHGLADGALLQRKTHRLLTLPGVRNAAALGAPDEKHGEAVQIFLATAEGGADVDPEAAGAAVTAELGEFRGGAEGTIFPRAGLSACGDAAITAWPWPGCNTHSQPPR
ncbi:hypothetical protein DDE74_32690 [Streptomyces lydicus]|uniref:Uncharacterized protein n=1 Tax=Streptomyces lydicus TaxID=47763 RepID=A0A3S9YIV7_9ACTN|nr:hypothetical protein [Streptomyces lydicus]AZS75043.1 hypothetical protein DDE74_32690 [Streptomyces lydicus]